MSTTAELFTIGQLARRTGVPARTIRFWSDAGLVPPTARSGSGYRLYDADAVARLDLVRTLRELGLGLDVVQAVLARACTVAEVAAAHVTVLDAQIRTLRLRRAVLSTVARGGHTIEETLVMHKLARLSAQERQQIIDDFVDDVFQGTGPDAPAAGIARGMRQLPADLPDDPAPEQVNAWVELAELVASEDFRQRARSMVLAGAVRHPGAARSTPRPSPSRQDRPRPRGSPRARPRVRRSSTASSRPALQPPSGPGCSSSSRRSPTPGWNGTGSCWPSSTASRCRRPSCRASSG